MIRIVDLTKKNRELFLFFFVCVCDFMFIENLGSETRM